MVYNTGVPVTCPPDSFHLFSVRGRVWHDRETLEEIMWLADSLSRHGRVEVERRFYVWDDLEGEYVSRTEVIA